MTDLPAQSAAATAAAPDDPSLKVGHSRRRTAWVVFSGGLESFNVPIVYVLFASYLVNAVAPNPVEGQKLLNYTQSISGVFAAALGLPLAFVAEDPRRRRWLMVLFVILNAAAGLAFWYAAPQSPVGALFVVFAAFGVAAAANDLLYIFYGSMLPEVAPPSILGRTSGVAQGAGWAFAIIATAIYMLVFVWPEAPPFGLDKAQGEPQRLLGLFAAVLMVLLCAPLLLQHAAPAPEKPKRTLNQWIDEEIASLLKERAVAIAVAARFVYWSGVALVMLNGSAIATSIMHWGTLGTSAFGLLVLVVGAVGAAGGGVLDDKIGTRGALAIVLVGLAVSLSLILTMSPDRLFAVFPVEPRADGARDLSSTAEYVVLALGALTGLFLGATGPMSRSLIARYAPADRVARYYGLSALAGNATNIFGPLFVAIVTGITHNQRAGLLVAPVFLLCGVAVLMALPKQDAR